MLFDIGLQECCLCTLRGGALKPTTKNGLWAHVICALVIKEVKFENVQQREPININKICFARMKLVSKLKFVFIF